ncbi:MAG: hypothetical protein ABI873_08620 [Marmoricola sp.]
MTPTTPSDQLVADRSTRSALHIDQGSTWTRTLLNKVPEVTVLFWVIKILSTTVGETAADYLNSNLGLGLSGTTAIMSVLLAVVLVFQFAVGRYIPAVYWLAVVLISVVGTLFSDNLVDNLGVSLFVSTGIFGVGLLLSFLAWYTSERTLSIHSVVTRRREAFYWLAILFTFALGTSAGDLISEKLAVGYPLTALIFGAIIAAITVAHYAFKLNAIVAFWAAYIMTRPLGASIGDYLTATHKDGGLGLGTTGTSLIFLAVIVAVVSWFTVQQRKQNQPVLAHHA